ncbi:hypothetical protein ELH99_09565 [Rhizobium leguminosarum]|uniref:hypothetical protein n=1 Tax=Rhizobium leguminosarum TaxID=384 RepID=UPI001031EE12|nr:hypothetical protein [Rhizobium leguminosarum]TAX50387.1 hypothetical protein ELH99_09565 [Rhizobium leguminosarum]
MKDDQCKQLLERLEALGAKEDGKYYPDRERLVLVPLSLLDDIVDALTEQPAKRGRPLGKQELSIHAARIARILKLGMGYDKDELLVAVVEEHGFDKETTLKLRIMLNAHLRPWNGIYLKHSQLNKMGAI